jgi:hypothetical protein
MYVIVDMRIQLRLECAKINSHEEKNEKEKILSLSLSLLIFEQLKQMKNN